MSREPDGIGRVLAAEHHDPHSVLGAHAERGGRPSFEARLVLAATLSPSYGIYSGFENLERVPVAPGSEEYLNSEKYELKERALDGPLLPLAAKLNGIRRARPALQRLDNVVFLDTADDELVAYARQAGPETVVCCVNLDPAAPREGLVTIPDELGLPASFTVRDLLSDQAWTWRSGGNYVRLVPGEQQAHVFGVEP